MALVCSKCRSENADGALTCRHCGATLQAAPTWGRSLMPDDDSFDPLSAPTLVMQHTAPASLPPIEETPLAEPPAGGAGRRIVLVLAAVVVLAAGAVWLLRPGDATPPVPAPVTVDRPASAATAAAASAASEPASAPASASAAAPSASVAAAGASAALPPQQATSTVAATPVAPASVPERRKRIPEPVPRPRAQQAPAVAPTVQPVPPAAPASPAAPTPERTKTVAELCAGNNMLMRGFCEQRECRKAEFASDTTCVKLKETEQRRLFQQ